MADTMLDIVDENDEIIGQALRSEIHAKGLLHREVHVWFITPDKRIIFQKRKPLPPKINLPILDATAGGHVELGDSYIDTALKEIFEETSLQLNESDLHFVKRYKVKEVFSDFGIVNNIFRNVYIYNFTKDIIDLQKEQDKGGGFVAISAVDFINRPEWLEKEYFVIPYLLESEMTGLFTGIVNG